jgi:FG-GAP-like repeat
MPASSTPSVAPVCAKALVLSLFLIAFSGFVLSQNSFMVGFMPTSSDGFEINRGDFNNDGIPDIIVGNNGGAALTVYLGKGDGTFKPAIDSGSVGDFDMTVGDFNGDGKLDVAIAGYNSSTQGVIQIMLGNGDGTFRAGQTINMSEIARSITTADFNGDGKLDLAVALDKVYLYKGAGDGTFASEGSVVVGNQNLLNQIRVGDFNGDGKPDIAVEDEYSVYVLWGTGAFTFNTTKVATYTFTGNITPV